MTVYCFLWNRHLGIRLQLEGAFKLVQKKIDSNLSYLRGDTWAARTLGAEQYMPLLITSTDSQFCQLLWHFRLWLLGTSSSRTLQIFLTPSSFSLNVLFSGLPGQEAFSST